jgi:hypothetical protein
LRRSSNNAASSGPSMREAGRSGDWCPFPLDDFIGATVMQERPLRCCRRSSAASRHWPESASCLMSHVSAGAVRRLAFGWRSARSAEIVGWSSGASRCCSVRYRHRRGYSLWASKFLTTLLFQLDPRDPVTFTAGVAVLVVVGVVAAWLPARRAALLDPASVLREG